MSLLTKLIEAGTPADLVEEVAMLLAEKRIASEAIEQRRAKDRERTARRRTRDVTECHVTERDNADPSLSPSPKENNSNPHPHTHPETKPRARKGPIPADWQPGPFGETTESRKVEDAWPPGERIAQIEQFKAHHRAKGSTFSDPQSAWSTWVLNSRKFGNVRQHSPSQRPTTRQLGERVAARYASAGSGSADSLPRLGAPGGHDR